MYELGVPPNGVEHDGRGLDRLRISGLLFEVRTERVELVFDGTSPKATFVPAGTVHAGPAPGPGARAYIFEIK